MTERPRYWERETYRQNELVLDSVWAVVVDFLLRNTAGSQRIYSPSTVDHTVSLKMAHVTENRFCHGIPLASRTLAEAS